MKARLQANHVAKANPSHVAPASSQKVWQKKHIEEIIRWFQHKLASAPLHIVMKQERHPPYVSTTLPYHERVPFAFLLLVPSTRSRFRIDIYR